VVCAFALQVQDSSLLRHHPLLLQWGFDALTQAARGGHTDVVKRLLEIKAPLIDPNARSIVSAAYSVSVRAEFITFLRPSASVWRHGTNPRCGVWARGSMQGSLGRATRATVHLQS
jgi:ankyrin repeat protein